MARPESKQWLRFIGSFWMAVIAVAAMGFSIDPKILIEKALEQNSLIVRFSDANAASVELRLDGAPIASRDVLPSHKAGEVTFALDPATLPQGAHVVEVVLYAADGKQIAKSSTNLSIAQRAKGPVSILKPKFGGEVSGAYEIQVDIGPNVSKPYVSLFIDQEFRQMRNVPPYRFLWDTTREEQGWHVIEAWAYDESMRTFKSPPIQVYVNNPGGRTERVDPGATQRDEGLLGPPGVESDVVGGPARFRGVEAEARLVPRESDFGGHAKPGGVTAIAFGSVSDVGSFVPLGKPSLDKALALSDARLSGQKLVTPEAVDLIRSDTPPPVVVKRRDERQDTAPAVKERSQPAVREDPKLGTNNDFVPLGEGNVEMAPANVGATPSVGVRTAPAGKATLPSIIAVRAGTHLNAATFSVLFDGAPIDFDVRPHTVSGVPVAPFRHLFQHAGGEVGWDNAQKVATASRPGTEVRIRVGDLFADLNGSRVRLDHAAFLEQGRTIIPISFVREALDVEVDFDPATGHVLITSKG